MKKSYLTSAFFAVALATFLCACSDVKEMPRLQLSSSSEQIVETSSSEEIESSSSEVIESSSVELPPSSSSVAPRPPKPEPSSSSAEPDRCAGAPNAALCDKRDGRIYRTVRIGGQVWMAENLKFQAPGSWCYEEKAENCSSYGRLYKWTTALGLDDSFLNKFAADSLVAERRGICPEGWRLFTYDDYVIVRGYKDEYSDGIKGLRSTYGFSGTNASGFSLTGAGMRTKLGAFDGLKEVMAWFRPEEYESDAANRAHHGLFDNNDFAPAKENRDLKVNGFSVRCVMVEK